MSIQTDLTRIKNAKAAIKAAIEGKGVTVPDATLLDGMAALIESIQAGGGQPFGKENVAIGTYTPASDIDFTTKDSAITIDFDLNAGNTLATFIFFRLTSTASKWGETLLLSAMRDYATLGAKNISGRSNASGDASTGKIVIVSSDKNHCTFYSGIGSSSLKAASTYGWIAIVI